MKKQTRIVEKKRRDGSLYYQAQHWQGNGYASLAGWYMFGSENAESATIEDAQKILDDCARDAARDDYERVVR